MKRLQGSAWHSLKNDLQIVQFMRTPGGNIKGIYKDKNGCRYTHWLNDDEKEECAMEDEKIYFKFDNGQEGFIYKTEKCDMQKELNDTIITLTNMVKEQEETIKRLEQEKFTLEIKTGAFENLTKLLKEQSDIMLFNDDKINQIFELCVEERQKSDREISRIHNGLLNPSVSLTELAIGCEFDIQRVLNAIFTIIKSEEETPCLREFKKYRDDWNDLKEYITQFTDPKYFNCNISKNYLDKMQEIEANHKDENL